MKFGRNQPRSQPIVLEARAGLAPAPPRVGFGRPEAENSSLTAALRFQKRASSVWAETARQQGENSDEG